MYHKQFLIHLYKIGIDHFPNFYETHHNTVGF